MKYKLSRFVVIRLPTLSDSQSKSTVCTKRSVTIKEGRLARKWFIYLSCNGVSHYRGVCIVDLYTYHVMGFLITMWYLDMLIDIPIM